MLHKSIFHKLGFTSNSCLRLSMYWISDFFSRSHVLRPFSNAFIDRFSSLLASSSSLRSCSFLDWNSSTFIRRADLSSSNTAICLFISSCKSVPEPKVNIGNIIHIQIGSAVPKKCLRRFFVL